MLKISILKVENPSCLWGRIVQETTDQYDGLLARMNNFYNDTTQDVRKLKPTSVEEGQVCVVYWSVMKSWCRAVVESIVVETVSYQARCFLVDHGERLVVSSGRIRVALQNFLQLPFWMRRFHLAGIKPTTLRVSVSEEKAELIPSLQWDSSATLYLHNLLQVSTQSEAVFLESESESTSIQLYLTVSNVKICVNDDLVAKKFALYIRVSADGGGPDEVEQFPVMLPTCMLMLGLTSERTKTPTHLLPVRSQDLASAGWPMAPSTPQIQQHDDQSDVRKELLATDSQSKRGSDSVVADSDSSEDSDSCVAAALNDNLSLFRERVETSQTEQTRAVTVEETWRSEEDWACSRLLSWLNPEPLNTDANDTPHNCLQVVLSDPLLVHSALPVEPCTNLDDAPIVDHLRWVLQRNEFVTLSPADRHSWPAVARGCNTVIVSQNAEQPLSYLTPLLSHILLNSIFTSLVSSSGPIAVLLCPGWERVQLVYDLLEKLKVTSSLHPAIVLLGVGKEEAKAVRIPKNCLLLLTTPFSLVRLLSCHCFLFLRLCHLVLDQADQLFTLAPDEMATVLQHFQKVTSSEEKIYCPQQIIAVAKRWTSHMESLVANHMAYPCIVVTVPEEAALYANIQQIVLMTMETSKISVLLATLDLNPDVSHKTLIVTNSAQEVEDVFKAVRNKSAFCLMIHEDLMHQSDFIVQQWRKGISARTHVILVTTTESLKSLGIRDASCVIHYDFPSSPKAFGSRLFCMIENFRNLSEQDQTDSCPRLRSVLLISDRNASHVIGLLRYLMRTNARIPPELLTFSQGIHKAREDRRTKMPLCSYLKSFGVCRDRSACPDRHKVMAHLDQSVLPASGIIEVVPLFIKTASVFFGRIIGDDDRGFDNMASQMNCYYADKRAAASDVVEGGLYAMQEDNVFFRVQVLSVPDRVVRLSFSVIVRFIDVGKEEAVRSHQLLLLPDQFHSLPPQAVEIIICRVKPVDAETNWHPKVTRTVSQKIRGLQHRARAVFSLGNSVFVDPMVRLSRMSGMKTIINEYNIQSEILSTGMGINNPDHLDLLRALCHDSTHLQGSNGTVSLDVLGDTFSCGTVPLRLEPCDPVSSVNQSLVAASLTLSTEPHHVPLCDHMSPFGNQSATVQTNSHTADLKSVDRIMRSRPEEELCPSLTSQSPALNTCDDGEDGGSQQVVSSSSETDDHKSFHPQVRWYQTSDSVIVTVKMTNPEAQRCHFYPDRVVYSGRLNGRTYRTDLQLQHSIAADSCCWEMKSNEPVLKLVKHQHGYWERLVRNKNIFVSYDMEHFEEEEDRTLDGQRFVENIGEENWFVASESDSD